MLDRLNSFTKPFSGPNQALVLSTLSIFCAYRVFETNCERRDYELIRKDLQKLTGRSLKKEDLHEHLSLSDREIRSKLHDDQALRKVATCHGGALLTSFFATVIDSLVISGSIDKSSRVAALPVATCLFTASGIAYISYLSIKHGDASNKR